MKADTAGGVGYSNDVESPFLPASHDVGHQARKKPLTLLPLIALIFFEVSGGPFGTEVSHTGPSAWAWSRRAFAGIGRSCQPIETHCAPGAFEISIICQPSFTWLFTGNMSLLKAVHHPEQQQLQQSWQVSGVHAQAPHPRTSNMCFVIAGCRRSWRAAARARGLPHFPAYLVSP
eukprot:GHUV01046508.1.p1 GENE.GHUV01046508.1~~GHUV01046508.1.p1  ORF type:complete len:175 (-),score=14.24 GHUV01046508.1:328-852(-)